MKFASKCFKEVFIIVFLILMQFNGYGQQKVKRELFRLDTNVVTMGYINQFKMEPGEKIEPVSERQGFTIQQKDSVLEILPSYAGEFKISFNTNQGIKDVILISKTTTQIYEGSVKNWEDQRKSKPFPDFNFTDLNGNKINTHRDFTGKLTVLNFWFVGCHPCIEEMPNLNELVKKYANNKNVQFFALTFDRKENVDECLKNNPFFYTTGLLSRSLIDSLKLTNGYPTNLILDDQLNIIDATVGCNVNFEKNKCDLKSKYEMIIGDYLKSKAALSIGK